MHASKKILARSVSFGVCFAVANLSVPYGAVATFGAPISANIVEVARAKQAADADLSKRRARSASRPLTMKEQRRLQGRAGENPYAAGQSKWDFVVSGINLITGNYSTSATDLSFDGGYGIPVNITRSYSANNPDEGPFGKGWNLSADVRSTAGGLLKSGGAPVRSVPVSFKERPSLQLNDPNAELGNGAATQPAAAVVATDAGGKEETIQRDVDGILTTPPWDKNTSDPVYEFVSLNGSTYQILVSNKVTTPDGTVYEYAKRGSYPNGTRPWDQPTATPEAANVLKVTTATDRQGNVTEYVYNTTTTVSFQKANGLVTENPLSYVQMPNGHRITFVWGDGAAGRPTNRVWKVKDNNDVRVVTYAYNAQGLLTGVTTPGGKTTSYGYSTPSVAPGYSGPIASGILSSITDPRGLTTTILSNMTSQVIFVPYGTVQQTAVLTRAVIAPNGTRFGLITIDNGAVGGELSYDGKFGAWDSAGNAIMDAQLGFTVDQAAANVTITVYDNRRVSPGKFSFGNLAALKRVHSLLNQDLLEETTYTHPYRSTDLRNSRALGYATFARVLNTQTTSYNFMGQPLSKSSLERVEAAPGFTAPADRASSVAYSYWGQDKYYQQMAVRDQSGRYSFTDYFPASAAGGKRGQTYRVYSAAFTSFAEDSNIPVPANTLPANTWKYRIRPTNLASHAAEFDYDSKGRPVDVWKLQKTSPWSYVRTRTEYGVDGDGSWGQASQVTEDFGGIQRTTQTLHYTSWGKADRVQDAKGQIFQTNYDLDGQVLSVARQDVSPSQTIVSYAYGSVAGTVSFGQPTSVTDGLSGVVQSITYATSGTGVGQPSGVSESGGSLPTYSVGYTYNVNGERASATYTTPTGDTTWQYGDYTETGSPLQYSRVFQTVRRLDSLGRPTAEEMHYQYDSSGRVLEATFAQTPANGFTPATGSPWYDSSNRANRRARAHYVYDGGGRVSTVEHYWDTWNGSGYNAEAILANSCAYELTGLNRGLKTQSQFWTRQTPGSAAWALQRTETYAYDATRDYLVGANYGDGLPGQTPTWSYDAAGNRNDTVADNLNRATSIGGTALTHDILGNRLSRGATTYQWDALNRMTSLNGGTSTYQYRADGMRVAKATGGVTTIYRHDGQMTFQESRSNGERIDQAMGARGIDWMQKTVGANSNVFFPLYDAHGNMVATLSRAGTGWSLSDQRSYDAWGQVRAGVANGDPSGRYCANLGHKQDDESGLIYMRARYYESGSGRFVSEDPAKDGENWFVYCQNLPTCKVDSDGKSAVEAFVAGLLVGFFTSFLGDLLNDGKVDFSSRNLAKVARLTVAGGIAGIAVNYISSFIKQSIPTMNPWARGASTVVGGLGAFVAAYMGIRAGEIMFELFAMAMMDNYEGMDGIKFEFWGPA